MVERSEVDIFVARAVCTSAFEAFVSIAFSSLVIVSPYEQRSFIGLKTPNAVNVHAYLCLYGVGVLLHNIIKNLEGHSNNFLYVTPLIEPIGEVFYHQAIQRHLVGVVNISVVQQ